MTVTTVLFDFYGTLAESDWESWWLAEILEARGYGFRPTADNTWSANAWDGQTHDEHSVSEEAYEAWEKDRWRGLLRDHEIHEDDVESIVKEFHTRRGEFTMAVISGITRISRTLKTLMPNSSRRSVPVSRPISTHRVPIARSSGVTRGAPA